MMTLGDVFQLDSHNNLSTSIIIFSNDSFTSMNVVTTTIPTDVWRYGHFLPNKAGEFQLWRAIREINLVPLVVINALYMLIGVVGNSTVCYVCAIRMPHTVLNSFVLSLAIAELLGCVLIIPLEITKTMNAYNFDYPKLCKTEQFLRSFVITFTSCVLIAIATERYQRIVKPHNRHVTMTQFRLTITVAVTFATIAAIPEAVLAGSQTLQTKSGKFVICSTYSSDRFAETVFPPLWACFVVLVYVISTAAIGSIYCVIAVTIWKRGKLQTNRRSRPNTPDLTLRRRVQCFYSKNHSSIMYLPHHHHSMTSAPDPENTDRFSHGSDSLPGYGLGSVFRHHSDFGLLATTASTTDDLEIQAEVHNTGSPLTPGSNKQEEDEHTPSSPWFSSSFTNTSRFLFESHQFDNQHHQQQENQQQYRHDRDSVNSGNSARHKGTTSQRTSGTVDPVLREFDSKHERSGQLSDEECGVRVENDCGDGHLQQQPEDKKRERRRFTAVFFDELYQTVSRRRQRQEAEFFERHGSTDDILTPPSLTPMGSIRSRSGYSRKRTTFIMFVMTTTTAISLLPHTIVLLYRLAHPSVEVHLPPDASILFYMAWNSFFISLASHPYVYGFWNGRFKKALISLFDGWREKTKRKRFANREEEHKDNNSSKS